jgi:hypothetical protein
MMASFHTVFPGNRPIQDENIAATSWHTRIMAQSNQVTEKSVSQQKRWGRIHGSQQPL